MTMPTQKLLQTDFTIQSILMVPMLLSYLIFMTGLAPGIVFVVAALLQVALAVVQLVTAVAYSIQFKDKIRRRYLLVAGVYLLFFAIAFPFVEDSRVPVLWLLIVAVLPSIIAVWYWWITFNDLKKIQVKFTKTAFQQVVKDNSLILRQL